MNFFVSLMASPKYLSDTFVATENSRVGHLWTFHSYYTRSSFICRPGIFGVFLGFFFDSLIKFALIFVVASGLGQVEMFRLVVFLSGVFFFALFCSYFAGGHLSATHSHSHCHYLRP